MSENDLLPKFVCTECWTNLSKFHQFYITVNEAKEAYLAQIVKNELSNIREDKSELKITSSKNEATEIIEPNGNRAPFDNSIESISNGPLGDDDLDIDNHDFDAVFCEVFIPDCDIQEFDASDAAPIKPSAEHSASHENIDAAPSMRGKKASRRNSKKMGAADKSRKRRAAKNSDADLSCEFCEKAFQSVNEAKSHYEEEHLIHAGEANVYDKKHIKRLNTKSMEV